MKQSKILSAASMLLTMACASFITVQADAQTTGDYRSAASGNWNSISTWERFDGVDFVAAGIAPTAADGIITIRAGHTVTASTFFTADQVVVESNATLSHTDGGFTIADGSGNDIQVSGTLLHSGNGFSGPGNIRILSGGSFGWTGGQLNTDLVIDLDAGSTASSGSTSPLLNNGTINNAGTWTLVNGGFASTAQPGLFHNLATGVVELNSWASTNNSWAQSTINDGVINKNNGDIAFSFTGRGVTNTGTINVPQGELALSNTTGTNTNTGTFAFGGPGTIFRINASFTNAAGGNITGLEHLQLQSNTFAAEPSSSMNTLDLFTVPTFSTLDIGQDITAEQLNFTGGSINGTAAINVPPGGSFNWTGGNFNATLDLAVGATTTFTGSPNLNNNGTINNAGTWNMESGNLQQSGNTGTFNNTATGIVNLNNWQSTTNSWQQNTFNHGIIHKNNGVVQFSFSLPFTNEAGGTLIVNSGTMRSTSTTLLRGLVNVTNGSAIIGPTNGVIAEGLTLLNDGSVTPLITFQGADPQFLNGTGTVEDLRMNGSGVVTLGGAQTVTDILTFTTGLLDLGDNDLVLTNAALGAVVGGNVNSYARTTGSGSLSRAVNGNSYLFPVGTSSYTPLTISLATGPQDRYSVHVQDGVSQEYGAAGVASGTMLTSNVVDRTWVVDEELPGGNTANITLQWNETDELTAFDRSNCAIADYDGGDWSIGTLATATGSGPFTRTITGLAAFRELCVTDGDAALNDIGTSVSSSESTSIQFYPNPASHTLFIHGIELNATRPNAGLIDASDRRVSLSMSMQGNTGTIDVSGLPNGLYVLELLDQRERIQKMRVVIMH